MTRLANTLDEMNRKLNQALRDLERINQRLDAAAAPDQDEEPPRAKAAAA